MYQYEMSPYSGIYPQSYSSINPQTQSNPFQSIGMQGIGYGQNYPQGVQQRHAFPQTASVLQTAPLQGTQGVFPFQGPQISPFQNVFQNPLTTFQQEFAGQQTPYLSPEQFAGVLSGQAGQQRGLGSVGLDPVFITELSRPARGLQEVADQLESLLPLPGTQPRDAEAFRKALYGATAHLFYAFGLLSSKGIFIPGDLPGKGRAELGGPANACREFGKELERFVDKAASGRGVIEHLSTLVERGKVCYLEVMRTLELGDSTAEQQSRKKAA